MGGLIYKKGTDKLAKSGKKTFFELEAINIDGELVEFSTLRGKKAIIVVNVACKCGLTSDHYKELVELYKLY